MAIRRKHVNAKGFTLLEVTLFLAISGALGMIAFLGLGPRLRNVQFTQSIRLVENTINNQFTDSLTGKNTRPDGFVCNGNPDGTLKISTAIGGADISVGSSTNCVINGKMVFLEQDQMTFYSIVSRRIGIGSNCTNPDTLDDVESCFHPRITGVVPDEPPISTSVAYSNGVKVKFPEPPATSYRGYGYIQSPNGVKKFNFFYNDVIASGPELTNGNTTVSGGPLKACFELADRQAQLELTVENIKPKVSFEGCSL
jgi:type II secretory pathway pseudopilin PulG